MTHWGFQLLLAVMQRYGKAHMGTATSWRLHQNRGRAHQPVWMQGGFSATGLAGVGEGVLAQLSTHPIQRYSFSLCGIHGNDQAQGSSRLLRSGLGS